MKKKTKIALGGVVALFAVLGVTSCTKSFCSNIDTARALYAFEPGITRIEVSESTSDVIKFEYEGSNYTISSAKFTVANFEPEKHAFYFGDDYVESGKVKHGRLTYLNNAISAGWKNGIVSIGSNHVEYFRRIDQLAFKEIFTAAIIKNGETTLNLSDEKDLAKFNRDLSYYSYRKFIEGENQSGWRRWNDLNKIVCDPTDTTFGTPLTIDQIPSNDFIKLYKSTMNNYVASYRTCLATNTDKYGSYGYSTDGIYVQAKTWGYAWQKGFFEGLLVYPIGWLVDQIGAGFSALGPGPAALLAIFFVTLIVRLIMMLATLKQTASNAKMTELQPEITKIQNKYPNSQTSQVEKQRMAQEMNDLYKKNKINPLTSLLVMVIQFPVFICVWGALSGASILTSGTVLGLSLSTPISQAMFNSANWTAAGNYAGVTAFFLFLLMAGSQTVSMLLPQWMQKARAKKVARLGKNPSQNSQNNKMKWVTYIMLAVIIFMGFSLVSAMGVYWFIGALISIAQTLITQAVTSRKRKKN